MKTLKRDEQGKVIVGWVSRLKSWNLQRKIQVGKVPRGRVHLEDLPAKEELDEAEMKLLRENPTEIVKLWNSGLREPEIAQKFNCRPGNVQAMIRHLQNIQRLSK